MNCSICSSLRTVSPAPPRRLRTSFPSFTAFKPNVLSAIPWAWQKADIREIRASVLVMSRMLLGYFPSVKRFNEATFPQGDILVGQKVRGHGLSNVVGVECIVLTKDGTKVVGVLLQGATPGTYSIRPLDIRRSELRDVTVEWAAPIRMIIRGQ